MPVRDLIERTIGRLGAAKQLDPPAQAAAEAVQRVTRPRIVKNALSGTWLGHQLHPVLTDVPIGAWVMATALDWTLGRNPSPDIADGVQRAARRLVALGVLGAIPAAAAGASDWSLSYGSDQRVGLVHGVTNLAATALQVGSWVARRRGSYGVGRALSTTGLGITIAAAYLGGHLSFTRGVGVNHTAFQEPATEWTEVAAESDLHDDTPLRVDAAGVPVVLVRHHGTIHALSATCVHAGGPLDEGRVDDGCVHCPWHDSVFRLTDGQPVRGPAANAQPVWEVKLSAGRVSVRAAAVD